MAETKKKEGFPGQKAVVIPPKILSRFCDGHPVIRHLYVTDIGYYPNALYHYRQRAHGINQHVLIYCIKGNGSVTLNKKKYLITPGTFVVLPANMPHEYASDEQDPWTIYWVHYKGSGSGAFTDMMLKKMDGFTGSVQFQQRRIELFEQIYTNIERGFSIDNLCYASFCLQLFLGSFSFDINFNYLTTRESNDNISVCIDYLQKNLDKPLTLQQIASAVNLSVSYFTSVFKKQTGFSIIEYFNNLKVQKACQYLQFTDLRVNEVADRIGFEDPYYFSRMFTKSMGMSPNKYRLKVRL